MMQVPAGGMNEISGDIPKSWGTDSSTVGYQENVGRQNQRDAWSTYTQDLLWDLRCPVYKYTRSFMNYYGIRDMKMQPIPFVIFSKPKISDNGLLLTISH